METLLEQLCALGPNGVLRLSITDPKERARLHEECRQYPDYILRTAYVDGDDPEYNVKCDGCQTWTSTKGSQNACCGEDYEEGCTSTCRRIQCPHCEDGDTDNGYIYWDCCDIKDHISEGKVRKIRKPWIATAKMILTRKGTPYKALGGAGVSYRKRYNV